MESFQQTHYRFHESEIKHGQRLGNFRHTRMLRRAILAYYNRNDYKDLPAYLRNMSIDELIAEAGVRLQGMEFVPASVSLKGAVVALSGHLFGSTQQRVGDKTRKRVSEGKAPSKVPYPYVDSEMGITLDNRTRKLIAESFDCLSRGSGYTLLAEFLNHKGFPTSTGRAWDKNTVRTFFQNPIHAGFYQSFDQKNGQKNTRGDIYLYPAKFAGSPVVSLEKWKQCNPVMLKRRIIVVEKAELGSSQFINLQIT